ncbi:hypothetical protein [Nocardia anaemiae]|uniref:hypothetical protein n=1 Tax=Nocardia anaemiae TaxID=263910 RepID=UPI0007A4A5C3|nr:hypothetical protein [Nocardia anaemiae]
MGEYLPTCQPGRPHGHARPDPAATRPEPGSATIETNLAAFARAALLFYRQSLPLLGGLLAQPKRMAAHGDSMRRHGAGPGHAIVGIAAYLRAEQQLGRVAADADTAAALLDGTCFHQAFLRFYQEGPEATAAPDELADSVARALVRGLGSVGDGLGGGADCPRPLVRWAAATAVMTSARQGR